MAAPHSDTDASPRGQTTVDPAPAQPAAFAFGANWARFLKTVDEARVQAAVDSLSEILGEDALREMRFLDAGCGSGLFSLAATRWDARVTSFDVDPQSVACTREMQRRFADSDADWTITSGSLLDAEFLEHLGEFDVVYSWGVVHHTGAMWQAIDNLQQRVAPGGLLWLAIYNDQGRISNRWRAIKRTYNGLPAWLRVPYVVLVGGGWAIWKLGGRLTAAGLSSLARLIKSGRAEQPLEPLRDDLRRQSARGMHPWYDLVDWIGGWPFEVAQPEQVLRYVRDRGFELIDLKTCGGRLGCNEYLFRRSDCPVST